MPQPEHKRQRKELGTVALPNGRPIPVLSLAELTLAVHTQSTCIGMIAAALQLGDQEKADTMLTQVTNTLAMMTVSLNHHSMSKGIGTLSFSEKGASVK